MESLFHGHAMQDLDFDSCNFLSRCLNGQIINLATEDLRCVRSTGSSWNGREGYLGCSEQVNFPCRCFWMERIIASRFGSL